MNHQEFLGEAYRLSSRYGEKYYPREVLEVIYTEVGALSLEWWKKTISNLLSTSKFAPLLPDIRTHSSPEKDKIKRDRVKTYIKTREAQESQFSDSEVLELLDTVKAVSLGKMSRPAVDSYCEMLKSSLKTQLAKFKCQRCHDTGLMLIEHDHQAPTAFKCSCQKGAYRPEDYAVLK